MTLLALALPYRPRLLLAKVTTYATNPPSQVASMLLRRQSRFWNRLVLGLVFFLGLPWAALFFRMGGAARMAPPPGSATYWVPRRPPEELDQGIRDPF